MQKASPGILQAGKRRVIAWALLLCIALAGEAVAQSAELRVIEANERGMLIEASAKWETGLTQAAARADERTLNDLLVMHLSRGLISESKTIVLPEPALPVVQIVSSDYDEIRLPRGEASEHLELQLDHPAAEVVHVGIERRRPAGTFVARFVTYDGATETLRRYRRIIARVQFRTADPAIRARLSQAFTNPHLEVPRSVLADGTWYKFPVEREGVYRIDRAYLQSLGAGSGIDMSRVKVYGNGGRPLPDLNSAPRPADLEENATWVSGDAVYFFAAAARGWRYNPEGERWEQYINPFSRHNYYFVRVDGEPGRRITDRGFPDYADAEVMPSFTAKHFVHDDIENLGQEGSGSGLDWLGPRVDMSFPNRVVLDTLLAGRVAGEVRYRSRFATRSNPAASLAFRGAGNQELGRFQPGTVILQGTAAQTGASARALVREFSETVPEGQPLSIQLSLIGTANEPRGWLDWLEVRYPRNFSAQEDFLTFYTPEDRSGRFEMRLSGFSAEPVVWDVTEHGNTQRLAVQASGNVYRVQVNAPPGSPRRLVAFAPASSRIGTPAEGERVANQNLHGIASYPDFVIVTPTEFRASAEELADHRRGEGLVVEVAEIHQIYNEFSGGVPDMRAVRDYFKFIYDRAPGEDRMLRYALLFGGGHFDFRQIEAVTHDPVNRNWIFPYQTDETLERERSYTSDDYFALLSDNEGVWSWTSATGVGFERIDIGIGRLPAQTPEEAALMVAKIKHYEDPATYGPWRTRYTFVADDHLPHTQEADLHTQNAEAAAWRVADLFPEVNLEKIYGISYDGVTTTGGRRIPAMNEDIMRGLHEGTLVWNYSGHGGWGGLTDERVFMIDHIRQLENWDRLAMFVTATCSFGRFDLNLQRSGAEELLINPRGGGIAAFTTTRIVWTSTGIDILNVGVNRALNLYLFSRSDDGSPRRLGEVYRLTKNTQAGAQGNNRKFNFLGDPTMRVGIPVREAQFTRINGQPLDGEPIQIRALDRVELEGIILGPGGERDLGFDGVADVTVFDAFRKIVIPDDRRRYLQHYELQSDLIYRGRVTVSQGAFRAEFVVPKDISYSDARGKLSIYASSDAIDAFGGSERVNVGGTAANPVTDTEGPQIELFLNDTTFVSGGMTGSSPTLLVRLFDESGINTIGTGVGHEMLMVMNEDERNAVDISSRFVADLDSYRSGQVRYQLPNLPEGSHTLSVKAWDILNNSSTSTLEFFVVPDANLALQHVFNYPNPMSSSTRFVFEHNQPAGTPARVQVRVYTLAGKPVRTIEAEDALPSGVLPVGPVQIPWDGRDEDFDQIATGVYLYKLRVEVDNGSEERQVSEVIERLVVIR